MAEVEAYSFRISGLYDTAKYIMQKGEEVSPRGQLTKEVRGFTLRLADPTDSLLNSTIRPSFHSGIAAAEAAQLVGGVSDPALMVRVAPNFANFLNGGAFLGAYGPRIRTQLPQLINVLKKDSGSRQALLQIWRPQDDLWADGAKDIPCTTSIQFFIRSNQLCVHVYMRSTDLWWGLSYDAFQFGQIQLTVANALGLEAGEYVHTSGSMHIYARDFEKIDSILHPSDPLVTDKPDYGPVLGFGRVEANIHLAMHDAQDVVSGTDRRSYATDDSTDWYWRTLEKYRV